MTKISQAVKINMIAEMLKDKEVCPTCGHETPVQPLITKEEALKLLGLTDETSNSGK